MGRSKHSVFTFYDEWLPFSSESMIISEMEWNHQMIKYLLVSCLADLPTLANADMFLMPVLHKMFLDH